MIIVTPNKGRITKIYKLLVVLNLVLLDLGVVFLFFRNAETQTVRERTVEKVYQDQPEVDKCGETCQEYIDQKVESLRITEPTPVSAPAPLAESPATVERVSYVPIPGSGSTLSNTWVDLPGTDFYFSRDEYPGLIKAYLEASMKLTNGNGEAFVRLYDVTHGIGVEGSEVSTQSQKTTVVVSGEVKFWAGRNLYRVQARSLTADTTVFDSGRIKIITEE